MTTSRRFTLVWALLLALTFGSFAVGIEQGAGFASQAAIIILVVAFLKVRLIGIHFMDLRHAPITLRIVFEGYLLIVMTVLIIIDLTVKA